MNNLFDSRSYKKTLTFSIFANILVKALYFINLFLIGTLISNDNSSDIYFYLYSVITLLNGFVGYVNSDAVMPECIRLINTNNVKKLNKLIGSFLLIYTICSFLLITIPILFPLEVLLIGSKFNITILSENKNLVVYFALLFVLTNLNSLFSTILLAHKYFTISTLCGGFSQLLGSFSLILFHEKIGIASVIYGNLIGVSISIIFMFHFIQNIIKLSINFCWYPSSFLRIKNNIIYILAGYIVYSIHIYYIGFCLSGLNENTISAYSFGQQLAFIPYQVLSYQIANVSFVKFSELYNKNAWIEFKTFLVKSILYVFLLMMSLSLIILSLNKWLFYIISEILSGKNSLFMNIFEDVFKYTLLSTIFLSVYLIFIKAFMAVNKFKEIIVFQIIYYVISLLLSIYAINNNNIYGLCLMSLFLSIVVSITIGIFFYAKNRKLYVLG